MKKTVKQKKKNDMSESSGMQSLQFEENLNISGMISPEKDDFVLMKHTSDFDFETLKRRQTWDSHG